MITPPDSASPPVRSAATPKPPAPVSETRQSQLVTIPGRQPARVAQADSATGQWPEAASTARLTDEHASPVAIAQVLPPELLCLIFNRLSLSAHNQCALVCRHWYACRPSTAMHITRQLESQHQRNQGWGFRDWAFAYSSRSYPFLAGHRCALLPQLQRQHEELQCRQERHSAAPSAVSGPLIQTAHHMLSALVRYALRQQIIQAQKLTLWPAVIDWEHSDFLDLIAFSHCSRWLAVCRQAHDEQPPFFRFHAWRRDGWHLEKTRPDPDQPVDDIAFSYTTPGTAYASHGTQLSVWQREPVTGCWHRIRQQSAGARYETYLLQEIQGGDLVTLSRALHDGEAWMLRFYHHRHHDRSLDLTSPETHYYSLEPQCTVIDTVRSRLALAVDSPRPRGPCKNEVHLWYRDMCYGEPLWRCQIHKLRPDLAMISSLSFSPHSLYLLALLADGQIHLWQLDTGHSWPERLIAPTAIDVAYQNFCHLTEFRRDGKQLVVPCAPRQLQFWNEGERDYWTRGARIEMPGNPSIGAAGMLHELTMTADGRTLVVRTDRRIDIWHQAPSDSWQWLVQHQTATDTVPQACLLGMGEAVCTTSGDAQGTLWIHGSDAQGQLLEKTRVALGEPIRSLFSSPDGLSLMVDLDAVQPPVLLHLGPSLLQDLARAKMPIQNLHHQ